MENKKAPGAEEVARYQTMADRVRRLSALRLQRHITNDPRDQIAFLDGLEVGRVQARVELNAFSRLVTEVLGVENDVFLRYLNEELEAEIGRLKEELGVVGWDDAGAPVLGEVQ